MTTDGKCNVFVAISIRKLCASITILYLQQMNTNINMSWSTLQNNTQNKAGKYKRWTALHSTSIHNTYYVVFAVAHILYVNVCVYSHHISYKICEHNV